MADLPLNRPMPPVDYRIYTTESLAELQCPACGKPYQFMMYPEKQTTDSQDPMEIFLNTECCGRIWRFHPFMWETEKIDLDDDSIKDRS
jgi:hypothetical protein